MTVEREKTPGEHYAEVLASMYGRSDKAFLTLARELGSATDEMMASTEDLIDGLVQTARAVRSVVRAVWRQNIAAWRLRPLLVDTIRRRQTAKTN